MGPGEALIALTAIISIFVLFPFTLFFGVIQYKKMKQGGGAASSMGVRELEHLIEEAVIRAQQPLEARLNRMEKLLRQLPPVQQTPEKTMGRVLEDEVLPIEEEQAPLRSRSSVR